MLGNEGHCDGFDNFFGNDGVLVGVDLLLPEEEKRKGKGKEEEKLCTYCTTEQAPSLLLERAMPL